MRCLSIVLISVFLFIISPLSGYIVEKPAETGIECTIFFNGGISTLWGDDYPDSEKNGAEAFSAGVLFGFPLGSRKVLLETGLYYNYRKTGLSDYGSIVGPAIELEYMTIPFSLAIRSDSNLALSFGFYFGIGLTAKETSENPLEYDFSSSANNFDFGFLFKISYRIEIKNNFYLAPALQFDFGFINIYDSGFEQRNLSVQTGLDLVFKL